MTEARSEGDFNRLMDTERVKFEKLLCDFQASVAPEIIDKIASGDSDNKIGICQKLFQLYKHYGNMNEMQLSEPQIAEYRLRASEQLAKYPKLLEGLSRMCVELYRQHADDCFETSDQSMTGGYGVDLKLVHIATLCFHSFTDCGKEFCLALAHIDTLFTDYAKPMLTHWLDKHTSKDACKALVSSALGFIYNMFYKNDSVIYNSLTQLQVVEPVMPYLRSASLYTQVQALVLIAFALDESKSQLYESATDVMQFLVTGLRETLDSADRRYHGFHTSELAVCVNRLALNEVNKELLVQLDLLPVLHAMCSRNKAEEVAKALDILFTLSFREENREPIRKQFSDVLQRLFCSSEATTGGDLWRNSAAMRGLDLNLGGSISAACPAVVRPASARHQKQAQQQQQSPNGGCHVMISYQHEQKQLAIRIKEALVRNNITVWIDYERMVEGGSTIDMMAEAVESSYAVLMCMSRTYKNSNNCRLEAEYAYKAQKRLIPLLMETKYRPNGWLGLMLGMKLYHDFSGKYPFEAKLAELLEVLRKAQLAGEEPAIGKTVVAPLAGSRPSSGVVGIGPREHHFPSAYAALPPIGAKDSRMRQWTADQVSQWARERGLPDCLLATGGGSGGGISGEDLHFLVVARDRAPEAFYRMAERYLQQPPPASSAPVAMANVARFVNALYEL